MLLLLTKYSQAVESGLFDQHELEQRALQVQVVQLTLERATMEYNVSFEAHKQLASSVNVFRSTVQPLNRKSPSATQAASPAAEGAASQ